MIREHTIRPRINVSREYVALQQSVIVARTCTHVQDTNIHKHIVIRAPCRFILQRTRHAVPRTPLGFTDRHCASIHQFI